jgi:hypothetical protein
MNEQITNTQGRAAVDQATPAPAPVTALLEGDDFALPVCTLRPGDGGFEGCEACQ